VTRLVIKMAVIVKFDFMGKPYKKIMVDYGSLLGPLRLIQLFLH